MCCKRGKRRAVSEIISLLHMRAARGIKAWRWAKGGRAEKMPPLLATKKRQKKTDTYKYNAGWWGDDRRLPRRQQDWIVEAIDRPSIAHDRGPYGRRAALDLDSTAARFRTDVQTGVRGRKYGTTTHIEQERSLAGEWEGRKVPRTSRSFLQVLGNIALGIGKEYGIELCRMGREAFRLVSGSRPAAIIHTPTTDFRPRKPGRAPIFQLALAALDPRILCTSVYEPIQFFPFPRQPSARHTISQKLRFRGHRGAIFAVLDPEGIQRDLFSPLLTSDGMTLIVADVVPAGSIEPNCRPSRDSSTGSRC